MDASRQGARRALRKPPAVVWVALLASVLWLVYGTAYVGYDFVFALDWGRDLAHLHTPHFVGRGYPTPHPLANLAGAILSPLGRHAADVVVAAATVLFAWLGWCAARLGAALFNPWVGAAFAALLLTRPLLVEYSLYSTVDIPFLALVLWAAGIEARSPRRGERVLIVLAVAGLLRPEAWGLSILYAVYVGRERSGRGRIRLAALALAAPAIWMLFDGVVTGDPLHSLHGTASAAGEIGRPQGLGTAFRAGPVYLKTILGSAVAWTGMAGALFALIAFFRRAALPAFLLAVTLLAFLVLGVADLPLLARYELVPAAMLALFCAVALLGWTCRPERPIPRPALVAVAVAAAVGVGLGVGDDRQNLVAVRHATQGRRAAEAAVRDVVLRPAALSAARECRHVQVYGFRLMPLVSLWTGRHVEDVTYEGGAPPTSGAVVAPRSGPGSIQLGWLVSPSELVGGQGVAAAGFRLIEASPSAAVYMRC
jgi:hypothetical protein